MREIVDISTYVILGAFSIGAAVILGWLFGWFD